MYDFRDKVTLITGAARGIGAALARALAAEGAKVCLLARDGEAAHQVAFSIRKDFGSETLVKACDIRDSHRVQQAITDVYTHFGKLDLVVNNAGILGQLSPISEADPSVWASVIDTNLNGSFYVAHFAAARMRRQSGGRIVFLSSSVGSTVRNGWGAYCVSKCAVEGLSRLIAAEAGETKVVSCTVNPGGTATAMRHAAFPKEDPARLPTPEAVAVAFLKILREPDDTLNGRSFNAREYL